MFDKMCYNTFYSVALEFLKSTTSFVSCNFISESVKQILNYAYASQFLFTMLSKSILQAAMDELTEHFHQCKSCLVIYSCTCQREYNTFEINKCKGCNDFYIRATNPMHCYWKWYYDNKMRPLLPEIIRSETQKASCFYDC